MKYIIYIFFFFHLFNPKIVAQHFVPPDSLNYKIINNEDSDGGGIYFKYNSNKVKIVLQVINLQKAQYDFILGEIKNRGNDDGIYYKKNRINPQIKKISCDSAFASYKKISGNNIISVTNSSFFETPSDIPFTEIAYPLKYNGKIIASGVSPYGPLTGKYPLKVLTFNDSSAFISDYNFETGEPLNSKKYLNQIVTLNYRDHPRVIEYKEENKTRYHLITAVDYTGNSQKETLLILSCDGKMSILDLASEMKKISSKIIDEEILTLDGGSSISVQGKNGDDIISTLNNVSVPVYLGFRNRNDKSSNK